MLRDLLRRLFARPRRPAHADFDAAFRLFREGRLEAAERAASGLTGMPLADVAYLRGLIARERQDLEAAAGFFELAVSEREAEGTFRLSLAEVLIALRRFDAASGHLAHFVALPSSSGPRRAAACVKGAECRLALDDSRGAREWYERALLLPAIYGSRDEIVHARARLSAELDALLERRLDPVTAPERTIGTTPFYLAYHAANNVALLQKVCAVCRRVYRAGTGAPRQPLAHGERRIRVGFVSTFFFGHSVGRTTIGLIRDLPRDRFAVTVFSLGQTEDDLQRAIAAAADRYVVVPDAVEDARRAIADAALDVLVYADIGMTPTTYFLALWRLAPIQVVTWGHSETSGIDTLDYYFSAAGVETEDAQRHYSETLVRPDAFFMPAYARPVLNRARGREELGLPEGGALYACLQAPYKLHPDFDALLAGILERDPTGKVVLLEARRPAWTEQLRTRLARALGPALDRVHFLPRVRHQKFLAALAAADVCLDPLYFGGCNSSAEAMALGVPVVTLPGSHLHGRFTLGLYAELGFLDCVVPTADRYVGLAVRLAREPELRARASREIIQRSGALFDRRDIALALGAFLEEAVLAATRSPVERIRAR
jgi:predicted O-linked N-acetylglucosamine transferase (SPINDLY family)